MANYVSQIRNLWSEVVFRMYTDLPAEKKSLLFSLSVACLLY